jgi:hypothetical protein
VVAEETSGPCPAPPASEAELPDRIQFWLRGLGTWDGNFDFNRSMSSLFLDGINKWQIISAVVAQNNCGVENLSVVQPLFNYPSWMFPLHVYI